MAAEAEREFTVENRLAPSLFGRHDEHLHRLEAGLGIEAYARGNVVRLHGSETAVEQALSVLTTLCAEVEQGRNISLREVDYAIRLAKAGELESVRRLEDEVIQITARGKRICPRTLGQRRYVEAIKSHGLTFGIGPAGTGKTYLAVAMAIRALQAKEIDRIVLTRPAVEAGEKLGFLPGDLQEKVDPYLRPLYDALYDILGVEVFQRYMERGIIEIAPLAYMRGRTLDDSFIILDEAQNTTREQMKMFLTRLGFGSKAVVTGDITQVDLPKGLVSGLAEIPAIMADVPGIAVVFLTDRDVVRHELVQHIIRAYERYEAGLRAEEDSPGRPTEE
ncbi:MAG: PhoH family protein [Firmicutes bacterium]|nr:PhoH family protein [Bacillota bacterium]